MLWLALSLLLGVRLIEASSNGVGLSCDVDNPNLGNAGRVRPSNRTMPWVLPPAWAGNQYTLRTADPSTASDPTTYTPGQYTNIYIRTTNQDAQFTGLVLYAVNAQGMKVGKWQVPLLAPYHSRDNDQCVVHSNADPKNYLSIFKFQGPPAGTGTVTIKALVKFGLAFPSDTSTFFWPNNAHITLTEKAPTVPRRWFEGNVGESCITVCLRNGLGCDLATMKARGNSPAMLAEVGLFTNCTAPLLPGCSSASPNVGAAGCFYHDDNCTQPAPGTAWVRNDPCAGLLPWSATTIYANSNDPASPKCCIVNNQKWCSNYGYNQNQNPLPYQQYGPWGGPNPVADCKPASGWPAGTDTVPLPVRTNPGKRAITCEATKNSAMDGLRICACSPDGKRQADAANAITIPLAIMLLPLLALM